jgi:hypothetical protein
MSSTMTSPTGPTGRSGPSGATGATRTGQTGPVSIQHDDPADVMPRDPQTDDRSGTITATPSEEMEPSTDSEADE